MTGYLFKQDYTKLNKQTNFTKVDLEFLDLS